MVVDAAARAASLSVCSRMRASCSRQAMQERGQPSVPIRAFSGDVGYTSDGQGGFFYGDSGSFDEFDTRGVALLQQLSASGRFLWRWTVAVVYDLLSAVLPSRSLTREVRWSLSRAASGVLVLLLLRSILSALIVVGGALSVLTVLSGFVAARREEAQWDGEEGGRGEGWSGTSGDGKRRDTDRQKTHKWAHGNRKGYNGDGIGVRTNTNEHIIAPFHLFISPTTTVARRHVNHVPTSPSMCSALYLSIDMAR